MIDGRVSAAKPSLSETTVRELDDQFFTSDPYAYIRSRILMLLSNDRPALDGAVAEEFTRLLGPSSVHYAHPDDRAANLQIVVDAFALRHQVAESLLRLLHVALHHQDGRSYWVELTDTPTRTIDVDCHTTSVDTSPPRAFAMFRDHDCRVPRSPTVARRR